MARAPGIQGRASWQVNTGSLSAEPDPSRTMEIHTKRNDHGRFSRVLLCVTARTSRAATLQQQTRFKLLPLWQQQTVLVPVCACVCYRTYPGDVMLQLGPRNNISENSGAISALYPPLVRSAVCCLLLSSVCCLLPLLLLSAAVSVSHRPPSSLRYFIVATVLQQPHFKAFPW